MDLKEYLYIKRTTIKDFAEYMGYSREHMSAVINGHLKPSKAMAKAIERATNGEVTAEEVLQRKKEN